MNNIYQSTFGIILKLKNVYYLNPIEQINTTNKEIVGKCWVNVQTILLYWI